MPDPPAAQATQKEEGERGQAPTTQVQLSEGKQKASGIRVEPAGRGTLTETVRLTGKLALNEDHIARIHPLVEGRIHQIKVQFGDQVKAGQVLAIIDSQQVGRAKLELFEAIQETRLARVNYEWQQTIRENTQALIGSLNKGLPITDIEKQFADRSMGDYRQQLLAAYAELFKAREDHKRLAAVTGEGVVPEKQLIAAKATLDAAQATFPGTMEQVAGLPNLRIRVNRKAIARYGINAADVLSAVEAIGGHQVGQVLEGQPRFALQVRLAPSWRDDLDRLRQVKIADPQGRQIPLAQLAELTLEEGPAQITRDAIQRRPLIEANVRGRDLAGFVADAQAALKRDMKLPSGYYVTWGGQFKNLQEATGRLMIAVPVALFLIFALLYITFSSMKPALLIYLNVPMAATGGIFALWLRDMPFSISAGVGFIALFGVAVLNGLVLVTCILQLRQEGKSLGEAVTEGALLRMRPVLMTALVASLGFIPMAFSTSAGAEVQRPLATVVIGGLMTSTLLTLVVLPAIYRWFEPARPEVEV